MYLNILLLFQLLLLAIAFVGASVLDVAEANTLGRRG